MLLLSFWETNKNAAAAAAAVSPAPPATARRLSPPPLPNPIALVVLCLQLPGPHFLSRARVSPQQQQHGGLGCTVVRTGLMGVEWSVVDAAIGWLVQSVLGTLLAGKLEAWTREVGLAGDVRRLEVGMRSVEMVLAAAAARGRELVGNEPLARSLDDLRQLLYDAEDVVDELDYYRLQLEIEQRTLFSPQFSIPKS